MLVLTISEDLDKLLENGCSTTIALLRELCRVVKVAIDLAIMFVVAILRSEHRRTHRACEVVDVVLSVQCCYV